jgi:hypothetical protein
LFRFKCRLINKETITQFKLSLQNESWESVYNSPYLDDNFNSLQDTFNQIFGSSFPLSLLKRGNVRNEWITNGIRISCKHKRDKTSFLKFGAKNKPSTNMQTGHNDQYIQIVKTTRFLGLYIDSHLNWKSHVNLIWPNFSATCFAVRSRVFLDSKELLRTVNFSYFHSIKTYGIMFWGNTSDSNFSTKESHQNHGQHTKKSIM